MERIPIKHSAMNQALSILRLLLILVCLTPYLAAQVPYAETKVFTKDGLSFNYPQGWTLTDKSTEQAQHLILSQAKSSILIMIVAYRDLISNKDQFQLALEDITNPYVENIGKNFAAPGHPVKRDHPCIELNGVRVSGFRLHGLSMNEQSTGEVYAFAKGRRFINLVYIRADKDASQAETAWTLILKTLRIDSNSATVAGPFAEKVVVPGGVLNGKALSMPRPKFSGFARSAGASGSVDVEVTVDEKGNVISARPVSGHPLLHKEAVDAAVRAKFVPTRICEQPVEVTGVITYNFIR